MYSSDSFHREGNHRDSNRGRYLDLRRDFCDLFFHGLNIRRYRFSLSLPLSLFSLHKMLPAWCRWEFRKQFIINSIKHRPLISNYRANINLNHEKEREREREEGGRFERIWLDSTLLDSLLTKLLELVSNRMDDDSNFLTIDTRLRNFLFIFPSFISLLFLLTHSYRYRARARTFTYLYI